MEKNIYSGLITALITPFKNGKVDEGALERLIDFQVNAGINKMVIGGSTGEGNSLEDDEYYHLVKSATDLANKRAKIIAGLATISTQASVNKIKRLGKLGIDGVMCTVPPYIRPGQNGLIEHFKALHDNSDLPLLLYINPGRTGVELSDDSILRLADCKRIIAVKDACNDMAKPLGLSSKLPIRFNMLTGDDGNAIAYSAHGGKGCVSVASNILPAECLELQNTLTKGDYKKALVLQQKLLKLYTAMFMESNPIGVKYAAYLLGLCSDEIKLPLTIASYNTQNAIKRVLEEFGKV